MIKKFSYDDVLLVPKKSGLSSRHEASPRTVLGSLRLDLPVVSSPMDTVTEENMALFMWEQGGLGVVHRYNPVGKQFAMVKWLKEMGARCGASVGVNGDSVERAEALVEAGVDMLMMDVAHGHSDAALSRAKDLLDSYGKDVFIMSPNIATVFAARDYAEIGIHGLRIGIGPGSACTTRVVTGVGYPQLSAVMEINDYVDTLSHRPYVLADGGIRTFGDIVKALAAGADAVLLGGMLAPFEIASGKRYYMPETGYNITPKMFGMSSSDTERHILMKEFRGMASDKALTERNRDERHVVEGDEFLIPVRRDHKEFMSKMRDSIQAGMAYLGARTLNELRLAAEFVEVSHHGAIEGTPHFNARRGNVD